jgi:PAS domain-containing protein
MNPEFNSELLNFALSSIPFGLAIWNPNTQRLTWSDTQAELHGLLLSEFDGTLNTFLHTLHPDDVSFVRDFLIQAQPIEHPIDIPLRPYRILQQNQPIRWIQMNAFSFSRDCFLLTTQDVTEFRNLGSVVIQENFQKRFWLTHTQDIIFMLSTEDGTIRDCSQAAALLLGQDAFAIIGRSFFEFVHLDHRPIVAHLLQNTAHAQILADVRIEISTRRARWFDLHWLSAIQGGCLILKPQLEFASGDRSRRSRLPRTHRH